MPPIIVKQRCQMQSLTQSLRGYKKTELSDKQEAKIKKKKNQEKKRMVNTMHEKTAGLSWL